ALSSTPSLSSTPTSTPPAALTPGLQARILAPAGVNIRSEPTIKAGRAGFYPAGALVLVLAGPVQADDYVWWQVDDEHGKSGWVAGVNREGELWLSSELGEPRPVNRPVRLGDTVYVSVAANRSLTIRYEPGTRGFVARRVVGGTLLSVLEGPVLLDGKRWWKVRRLDDGLTGWAAEGDQKTRWLKPVE
ncbi:MAG TPA: SH3 domain-containing protein, partial [Caldilineae bacterium]|nr:SH3 domain-containing protein [Caldilineae bacterium]